VSESDFGVTKAIILMESSV